MTEQNGQPSGSKLSIWLLGLAAIISAITLVLGNLGELKSAWTSLVDNPVIDTQHPAPPVKEDKVISEPKEAEPLQTQAPKGEALPQIVTYKLDVRTGTKDKAGTDATIRFELVGNDNQPLVKNESGLGAKFQAGNLNTVLITGADIGNVERIEVSHDSRGRKSGWLLTSILVTNLQTNRQWFFPCGQWLADSHGDKKTNRTMNLESCN